MSEINKYGYREIYGIKRFSFENSNNDDLLFDFLTTSNPMSTLSTTKLPYLSDYLVGSKFIITTDKGVYPQIVLTQQKSRIDVCNLFANLVPNGVWKIDTVISENIYRFFSSSEKIISIEYIDGIGNVWVKTQDTGIISITDCMYQFGTYLTVGISETENTVDGVIPYTAGVIPNGGYNKLAYGLNTIVAFGDIPAYSLDGINFLASTCIGTTANKRGAFGLGLFVMVGGGGVSQYSNDGITFAPFFTVPDIRNDDICFSGVDFFTCGYEIGTNYPNIKISNDGVNFNKILTTPTTALTVQRIVANGNNVCAITNIGNSILYSLDNGLTWNSQTFVDSLNQIHFSNGIYFLSSSTNVNYIYKSLDLITWEKIILPESCVVGGFASNGNEILIMCFNKILKSV